MGLVVPAKSRARLSDIRPFRKALPPPLVVVRGRIELRQMESYELRGEFWRHFIDHFRPRWPKVSILSSRNRIA